MPTWLRRIKVKRVALVDNGANQDADIVFYKRENHNTAVVKQWGERITKKAEYDALSTSEKLRLFYDLADGGLLRL